MAAPQVILAKETIGRNGHLTAHVEWTAQEADDLSNITILDPDIDASKKYSNTRFQVLNVQYDSDDGIEARLEFDIIPFQPEALIVGIAGGVTSGQRNFVKESLHGCRPDPNPLSPSKIILTTIGALPGQSLMIEMNYRESGTRPF